MLSEVFYSLLLTSTIGFLIATIRMCYKSKCQTVEIGCIKINRNVELEEKEQEFITTHPQPQDSKENL